MASRDLWSVKPCLSAAVTARAASHGISRTATVRDAVRPPGGLLLPLLEISWACSVMSGKQTADEIADRVVEAAAFLKALSDEGRLMILCHLADHE